MACFGPVYVLGVDHLMCLLPLALRRCRCFCIVRIICWDLVSYLVPRFDNTSSEVVRHASKTIKSCDPQQLSHFLSTTQHQHASKSTYTHCPSLFGSSRMLQTVVPCGRVHCPARVRGGMITVHQRNVARRAVVAPEAPVQTVSGADEESGAKVHVDGIMMQGVPNRLVCYHYLSSLTGSGGPGAAQHN